MPLLRYTSLSPSPSPPPSSSLQSVPYHQPRRAPDLTPEIGASGGVEGRAIEKIDASVRTGDGAEVEATIPIDIFNSKNIKSTNHAEVEVEAEIEVRSATESSEVVGIAYVCYWTASYAGVKCPWCDEIEIHSLDVARGDIPYQTPSSPSTTPRRNKTPNKKKEDNNQNQIRQSHCFRALGLKYCLVWPVDDDDQAQGLTWELDNERRRFTTIGIEYPMDLFTIGESSSVASAERGRFPFNSEDLAQLCSFSSGGLGEIRDAKGNTALIRACRNGNVNSVRALLQEGADVNATNTMGWSSLHQAAFHGRVEVVLCLLGIERLDLEAMEWLGRDGMLFNDPLEDSGPLSYQEEVLRNHNRKLITALISAKIAATGPSKDDRRITKDDPFRRPKPKIYNHTAIASYRHPHRPSSSPTGTLSLLAPVAAVRTKDVLRVTLGVLYRGPRLESPFPPLYITSGWANLYKPLDGTELLDNRFCTNEVREIARAIGHKLAIKRDCHAQWPGQSAASHVEKTLIAVFLRKHYIGHDRLREHEDWRKLKDIQPPNPLRKAKICIDKYPCRDCLQFRDKVAAAFGVEIEIEVMTRIIAAPPEESLRSPAMTSMTPSTPRRSGRVPTGMSWIPPDEDYGVFPDVSSLQGRRKEIQIAAVVEEPLGTTTEENVLLDDWQDVAARLAKDAAPAPSCSNESGQQTESLAPYSRNPELAKRKSRSTLFAREVGSRRRKNG